MTLLDERLLLPARLDLPGKNRARPERRRTGPSEDESHPPRKVHGPGAIPNRSRTSRIPRPPGARSFNDLISVSLI